MILVIILNRLNGRSFEIFLSNEPRKGMSVKMTVEKFSAIMKKLTVAVIIAAVVIAGVVLFTLLEPLDSIAAAFLDRENYKAAAYTMRVSYFFDRDVHSIYYTCLYSGGTLGKSDNDIKKLIGYYEELLSHKDIPGIAEVTAPDLSPSKRIDSLPLFMAASIMLLSFINIYAGLSFFLQVRQREYRVFELCGASPWYVLLDISLFTLFLSLIPYILGTVLYAALAYFLNNAGFTCVLNPFTSLVTLIILLACSLLTIRPLLKRQLSIWTFS